MNHPTQEEPAALQLAKQLRANIITGSDWPNSEDELLRLNAASELERMYMLICARDFLSDPAAVVAAAGVVA